MVTLCGNQEFSLDHKYTDFEIIHFLISKKKKCRNIIDLAHLCQRNEKHVGRSVSSDGMFDGMAVSDSPYV